MPPTVKMSKFMNCFLYRTLEKKRSVIRQSIKTLSQASQRNNGQASTELCLSEHEIQPRNIKVNIGHPQGFFSIFQFNERTHFFQNFAGAVLIPGWIVSFIWNLYFFIDAYLAVKDS